MNWFKRILMIAADGSPGGGAAPPAPTAPPPTPQAQGGTPTIDRAAEEALIKRGRDAAYAELRRSGALKRSYIQTQEGTSSGGDEPAKPAASDPALFRRLDRALNRSGHAASLKDNAYARLEAAFVAEKPDDADAWVAGYFDDLGIAKPAVASSATATTATTNQPSNAPVADKPVSDRGAPATSKTPPEEANLVSMSNDDRAALVRSKGLKWYTQKLREQLRGVRVTVRG